jgi:6-phospho-beta-glucosidase
MGNTIAVIGAGSVYTPELVTEFFKDGGKLVKFDRMTLMDIDKRRLGIVGGLTRRMARRQGVRAPIELTTSLSRAVRGARFVIVQIRVGGNKARFLDESIPVRHGVIGQETTGPGGMFKALRTIPAVTAIARAVKRHAPGAWILNFANPSGLVTEAVLKAVPGVKMLGICSAQLGRKWWVSEFIKADPKRIRIKSVGLNHLSWVYRIWLDGREITERFFTRTKKFGWWDAELIRAVRGIPIGYLQYYYNTDKMLAHMKHGLKRSQQVMKIEKKLLRRYADPKLDEPPEELKQRGGSGYSAAMTTVMRALTGEKPAVIPMNVRNRGSVPGFADGAVLEIESRLTPRAVTPLKYSLAEIPVNQLGLMHAVKAYETLTAEAALTGNYITALAAMVAHPLVPSVSTGRKILDEMLRAHRKYLPQFK